MKRSQLLTHNQSFDYLTAVSVWLLFYIFHASEEENSDLIFKGSFIEGIIITPLCWMFLYTLQGAYDAVERNYRLKTIRSTFFRRLPCTMLVFCIGLVRNNNS